MSALLARFAEWLEGVLLYIPQQLFTWVADAIIVIVDAIPLPAWYADVVLSSGSVGNGMLWAVNFLSLDAGLPIVLSAYSVRFFIRRLPVVG
jgi:hypothetical protein